MSDSLVTSVEATARTLESQLLELEDKIRTTRAERDSFKRKEKQLEKSLVVVQAELKQELDLKKKVVKKFGGGDVGHWLARSFHQSETDEEQGYDSDTTTAAPFVRSLSPPSPRIIKSEFDFAFNAAFSSTFNDEQLPDSNFLPSISTFTRDFTEHNPQEFDHQNPNIDLYVPKLAFGSSSQMFMPSPGQVTPQPRKILGDLPTFASPTNQNVDQTFVFKKEESITMLLRSGSLKKVNMQPRKKVSLRRAGSRKDTSSFITENAMVRI